MRVHSILFLALLVWACDDGDASGCPGAPAVLDLDGPTPWILCGAEPISIALPDGAVQIEVDASEAVEGVTYAGDDMNDFAQGERFTLVSDADGHQVSIQGEPGTRVELTARRVADACAGAVLPLKVGTPLNVQICADGISVVRVPASPLGIRIDISADGPGTALLRWSGDPAPLTEQPVDAEALTWSHAGLVLEIVLQAPADTQAIIESRYIIEGPLPPQADLAEVTLIGIFETSEYRPGGLGSYDYVDREGLSGFRGELWRDETLLQVQTNAMGRVQLDHLGPPGRYTMKIAPAAVGDLFTVQMVNLDGELVRQTIDEVDADRGQQTSSGDRRAEPRFKAAHRVIDTQRRLASFISREAQFEPMTIRWAPDHRPDCHVCIRDGVVELTGNPFEDSFHAESKFQQDPTMMRRMTVHHLFTQLGLALPPEGGRTNQPVSATQAWSQGVATFVAAWLAESRHQVHRVGNRYEYVDLFRLTLSETVEEVDMGDFIEVVQGRPRERLRPIMVAGALWNLSNDVFRNHPWDAEPIPRDMVIETLFNGPFVDASPEGPDLGDFADALACQDLTDAQRQHLSLTLNSYNAVCPDAQANP